MLGRKQYLDEYNRQQLEKKREFAKKILKAVSIHIDEKSEDERLTEAGKVLGIEKLTPEQAAKLRDTLHWALKIKSDHIDKLKALFSGESD